MHFVLTGTYNSCNKGDAAMQLSAASGLVKKYPNCSVTILSPFPALDRPFYAPVPVAECNRRRLIVATIDLLRAVLWRWTRLNFLLSEPLKLTLAADLVVDLSGDMLTDDYGPHVAYSHYIPLLRALLLGRPYFICAQSIGPFRITRFLSRLIMNRAHTITARDAITSAYLRDMRVNPDLVRQTADLAFLLEPVSQERADQILWDEGMEPDDRPLIGISVSGLIERKFQAANPAAARTRFAELMARVLENIGRQENARFLFVAHVTGPAASKDDRKAAERVVQELAPDVSFTVMQHEYRPEEIKGVIARCNVFCGARMHANIAALSSAVPVVAISYSHKTPGIMASCNVAEFVAPIESLTAESLQSSIAAAFAEREEIRERLRTATASLAAEASLNFDLADQIRRKTAIVFR